MSPYPALRGLRIGCVQYLNSKPLIAAYDGDVVFDHPSKLARDLAAGELDAALVPIFEALGPRSYRAVDDVAIACDGAVYSVFLAYTGRLEDVRRVALDPASLTSVHLVQVLLREFHGIAPECVRASAGAEDLRAGEAQLLIGNQAIAFRREATGDVRFLDLGEEWLKQTGLPFVFAVWLLRPDLPELPRIARDFRRLKTEGIPLIDDIARGEKEIGADLARSYLTEHIRFGLGPREKAAIERFRELLVKHGFLSERGAPLEFV